MGVVLARTGIHPLVWTYLGVVLAFLSGLSYSRQFTLDARLGGALLLLSGFSDVMDGAVARVQKLVSHRGAFLDSSLDRIGEIVVFTGILLGGWAEASVVILALSLSLTVSYLRAKAESLNVHIAGVGLGERAERILALGLLSIIGYTWLGVLVVAVLAAATVIERTWLVQRVLKIRHLARASE